MSRAVRKMQARMRAQQEAEEAEGAEEEGSSEEEEEVAKPSRFANFAAAFSSDDDDDEEEEASGSAESPRVPKFASAKPKAAKKKKKKEEDEEEENKQREVDGWDALDEIEQRVETPEDTEKSDDETDDERDVAGKHVLKIEKDLFNIEKELQRVMVGEERRTNTNTAKVRLAGKLVHHRKLWLFTPKDPWPRPDTEVKMSMQSGLDGIPEFGFQPEMSYTRAYQEYAGIVQAQDIQSLYEFIHKYKFFPPACLSVADIMRSHSEHEQAFQLIQRAIYGMECFFHPSFSPFRVGQNKAAASNEPHRARLLLQTKNGEVTNWLLLKALWMYMTALGGQGLYRSCLEVNKFIVSISMPNDYAHALLHLDYHALRSRNHEWLFEFCRLFLAQDCDVFGQIKIDDYSDRVVTLDMLLPNFAFSCALAGYMSFPEKLDMNKIPNVPLQSLHVKKGIKKEEIDEDYDGCVLVHARLMRALLYFPLALRVLLDQWGTDLETHPRNIGAGPHKKWREILDSNPFNPETALHFQHKEHNDAMHKIIAFFITRTITLWKNDQCLGWLYRVCARLSKVYESPPFAEELDEQRGIWSTLPNTLLSNDVYSDVMASEARQGTPTMPMGITNAEAAALPSGGWTKIHKFKVTNVK